MTIRERAPHLWLWRKEVAIGLRGQRPDDLRTWRLDDPLWKAACYEAMALDLCRQGMARTAALLFDRAYQVYAEGFGLIAPSKPGRKP
jgi:hypothetical protein